MPDPTSVPAGDEGYWERLYWHVVGIDQSDDELLLGEDLDRTALPYATISRDGRWLALHAHLMPTRTATLTTPRTSPSSTPTRPTTGWSTV
ncbi:MAG: hypothetical protein ACRD2W_11535 [Acidimicrobiales bacterium]